MDWTFETRKEDLVTKTVLAGDSKAKGRRPLRRIEFTGLRSFESYKSCVDKSLGTHNGPRDSNQLYTAASNRLHNSIT